MGRWDRWRRGLGSRLYGTDNLAHDQERLLEAWALVNPSLNGAIEGGSRRFSASSGVEPLEQDYGAYLKSVGLFPWVTACVDAIATAGASVPFRLMKGKPGEAEEVLDHPLLDILRDPNDEQGWFEFAYSALQHLGMTGESMITAVGMPEDTPFVKPEELWIVQPDTTAPVYDKRMIKKGKGGSAIMGWSQVTEGGVTRKFTPESIVLAKRPHPRDPIRGLSPIKRIECALNLLWSVLQSNKAYLANGAGPGLVFRFGIAPDTPLAQAFEKKLMASHAGPQNRGKHLVLYGQNIELLKDRVMDTAEDAQYVELMHIVREWILAEYKCPPFAIGLLEHANWSNSVEQQQFFYEMAVKPANRLLFDSWNTSPLVQLYDDGLFLEHDYSGISALQPNKAETTKSAVEAYKAGIVTLNEARADLGKDATEEGGDEFFEQTNPFAGLFGEGEKDEPPEDEAEDLMQADAYWGLVRDAKQLRSVGLIADGRAVRWRAAEQRRDPITRRWARLWRGLFKDLRAQVLEEVNRQTLAVPFGMDPLFDAEELASSWRAAIEDLAIRTFQKGAEDMGQEVAGEMVPFPIDDPRIAAYLETATSQRIKTIAENRLAEVTDLVQEATAEGVSVEELQTRLREHFDRNDTTWARRIARTETAGLYNRGAEAGLEDAGFAEKEWLSSRDGDVRPTHNAMDGTSARVGEDFVFPSGAHGPFPGEINTAEENINCRCTIIPGVE